MTTQSSEAPDLSRVPRELLERVADVALTVAPEAPSVAELRAALAPPKPLRTESERNAERDSLHTLHAEMCAEFAGPKYGQADYFASVDLATGKRWVDAVESLLRDERRGKAEPTVCDHSGIGIPGCVMCDPRKDPDPQRAALEAIRAAINLPGTNYNVFLIIDAELKKVGL